MSEMPERIWADDENCWWVALLMEGGGTEYIRADVHRAEVERLRLDTPTASQKIWRDACNEARAECEKLRKVLCESEAEMERLHRDYQRMEEKFRHACEIAQRERDHYKAVADKFIDIEVKKIQMSTTPTTYPVKPE